MWVFICVYVPVPGSHSSIRVLASCLTWCVCSRRRRRKDYKKEQTKIICWHAMMLRDSQQLNKWIQAAVALVSNVTQILSNVGKVISSQTQYPSACYNMCYCKKQLPSKTFSGHQTSCCKINSETQGLGKQLPWLYLSIRKTDRSGKKLVYLLGWWFAFCWGKASLGFCMKHFCHLLAKISKCLKESKHKLKPIYDMIYDLLSQWQIGNILNTVIYSYIIICTHIHTHTNIWTIYIHDCERGTNSCNIIKK